MPNHCENDLIITGPAAILRRFWAKVEATAHEEKHWNDGTITVMDLLEAHYPTPPELLDDGLCPAGTGDDARAIVYGDYRRTNVVRWILDPVANDSWRSAYSAWCTERGISDIERDSPSRDLVIRYFTESEDGKRIFGAGLREMADAQQTAREVTGCSSAYDWHIKYWGTKWGDYDWWDLKTDLGVEGGRKVNGRVSLSFMSAWSPPIEALQYIARKWPMLTFDLRYYEAGMGYKGHFKIKGEETLISDYSESYRGGRGG